jgi:hypothetical protein
MTFDMHNLQVRTDSVHKAQERNNTVYFEC